MCEFGQKYANLVQISLHFKCSFQKENNQKSGPVNNQNIKVDNQPKNENENITKEQPLIQTIQASEALVCEFSPAS